MDNPDRAKALEPVKKAIEILGAPVPVLINLDPEADFAHVSAWDKAHGVKTDGYISIIKADGIKCARCWKICLDTNTHAWADVCLRCNDALEAMFQIKMHKAIEQVYKEMGG